MRKIKFRAWNVSKDGYMKLHGYLGNTFWDNGELWTVQASIIIEQFTGILDKNGKEIYEGDIVRWYINDVAPEGIVEYLPDSGGYDLKNFHDEYHVCNDWLRGEYEVIGNIHENPELLK